MKEVKVAAFSLSWTQKVERGGAFDDYNFCSKSHNCFHFTEVPAYSLLYDNIKNINLDLDIHKNPTVND